MGKSRLIEQCVSEITNLSNHCPDNKVTQSNHPVAKENELPSFITSLSTTIFKPIALRSIKLETADYPKYHISDLIDISQLQQLFDSFYELTGIMHAILDADNNILSQTGWHDICTKFHRVCPRSEERCKQSDSFIASHLHDGPYIGYKCLNGLMDYATPIVVEGQHLATIFVGQVLHEPPDEEFFRQQARKFGFDEEAYIAALQDVNIVSKKQIEPIMKYYSKMGQVLASMGLERMHQLDAAEANFFKAFNCIPEPVAISTFKDGRFLEVNKSFIEHSGYQKHEVIGRSFLELGIGISSNERARIIKQLKKHGSICDLETVYRSKSGELRVTLTSAEIILIGNQPHILSVHKDITERNKIEEALRLSEERFSKAFNFSPLPTALISIDDERFFDVNDSTCSLLGYPRSAILGHTLTELGIHSDEVEIAKRILGNNDSVLNMEIHFHINNKEIRLGLFSAEKLKINGKDCALCIMSDISERIKMQKELMRLDRLNMIGEMAASIGHEIRNPLTSVRGFLQMFEDKYSQDKENLKLMIEELDRANGIITGFLSLAKNRMVELKKTNLNSLIKNMYPLLQANAMLQEKHIQINTEYIPDLLIDEKEIRQLILNMVHNGMESMDAGGIIIIKTFIQEPFAVLSIHDQGKGIDPETMNKLGTPFFTTKEKGTGLGLAVCYGIASRHKAKIEVDSSPTGSIFKVIFPIHLNHNSLI